jgi:hypothetical protein
MLKKIIFVTLVTLISISSIHANTNNLCATAGGTWNTHAVVYLEGREICQYAGKLSLTPTQIDPHDSSNFAMNVSFISISGDCQNPEQFRAPVLCYENKISSNTPLMQISGMISDDSKSASLSGKIDMWMPIKNQDYIADIEISLNKNMN